MNDSTGASEDDVLDTTFFNIALCALSFALMIFVSAGNILTLLSIVMTPVLRTQANIYVFSLAIADLFVGLGFSLTGIFMIPTLKRQYFDLNINLCVFMQGSVIGSMVASSFHMTLMSFDRYIYITHPYAYPRIFTKQNIFVFLTVIWILGVFMILSPQFVHKDTSTRERDCDLELTLPLWYLFYMTGFTFFANVIIAGVLYSKILLAAIKQRKAIHATSAKVGKIGNDEADIHEKKSSAKSFKVGLKSIKFFFTIFGFYFVCVTPCFIAISIDLYSSINEDLVRTTTLIVMLNSGMNFIIYVVINRQFRRAFSDILHCRPSSQ